MGLAIVLATTKYVQLAEIKINNQLTYNPHSHAKETFITRFFGHRRS